MNQYSALLNDIIENGEKRPSRPNIDTLSVFGRQLKFMNIQAHFPLVTTKKMFFKGVVHELLWMLNGETNVKSLNEVGVNIWNEWADSTGDLGPVYGKQWRSWNGRIDQLREVINQIKNNPYSRRHIISAWNVEDIPHMALPPCHVLFQFYVSPEGYLDCSLYQRSADAFLGVPFNIASYALLTILVAKECGLAPRNFIHSFGDVHIYDNHIEQVKTQLTRRPYPSPIVRVSNFDSIFNVTAADIILENYHCHKPLKGAVAV